MYNPIDTETLIDALRPLTQFTKLTKVDCERARQLVAIYDDGQRELARLARPHAVVSPEVADAFGLRGMPDVTVTVDKQ